MTGAVETLAIEPGALTLPLLRRIARHPVAIALAPQARARIEASAADIDRIGKSGKTVYGINTGFGKLAQTHIATERLAELQTKLVLSHATGTGPLLDDAVVRLIIALKIGALARGFSGVRYDVVEALQALLAHEIYPCVPAKGSCGASGDLAPLAHIGAALIGVGEVRVNGQILAATDGLDQAGLQPLTLGPKEGLAILNGTQASTALALTGLFATEDLFASAVAAGALAVDAALGSHAPFDERIQAVKGHQGQIDVAARYRALLGDSEIHHSHANCDEVQDPYSLRCQPQVMGACLDHIRFAARTLEIEANAVSDNPLVFSDSGDVLSGGNFHAEPVAMAADVLALAIAEIGALSERRIALLVDPNTSRLPAFLVAESGINSGFMLAQVTAAALASENKSLAHPASVDSIPTSANQEDHVSMATFAARRLSDMADNAAGIVAVELLAAAQGIDFRKPLRTSEPLSRIHDDIRGQVAFYEQDRFFAPDLAKIKALVQSGGHLECAPGLLPSQTSME
ncbi:MAG: histidine ammonia-lyase [Sphingomonadales bacterium]